MAESLTRKSPKKEHLMNNARLAMMLQILLIMVFAASCSGPLPTAPLSPDNQLSPLSPLPSATTESTVMDHPPSDALRPTLAPDTSAITGQLTRSGTQTPISDTTVWLGRVFWNEQRTDGAFAIEAAAGFSAVTDSTGRFYITGVTPGEFVIVVGDLEGQYEVVSEPDDPDKALVVALLPGKILEVNELIVDLVQP